MPRGITKKLLHQGSATLNTILLYSAQQRSIVRSSTTGFVETFRTADHLKSGAFIILHTTSQLGRVLLQEKRLAVTERNQARNTPFVTPVTALLVAAKRHAGIEFEMRVDPDRACLDLLGNAIRTVHIPGPHRCSETHLRVVGFPDGLFFGLEREEWYDWTWGFLSIFLSIFGTFCA